MVHGIGQGIGLRQGKRHTGPPVGHHLARLVSGQVEGDAHLGGLLGKLGQVFLGHAGLPGGGDDGRDAVRRHRDAPGHVHDRFVHCPELGGGIEVYHLGHIGHRAFKRHGLAGRHTEGPDQESGGQRRRTHSQGKVAHAFPQTCGRGVGHVHGSRDAAQGTGDHVHQGQGGEYGENFHAQTLLQPLRRRKLRMKTARITQSVAQRNRCRALRRRKTANGRCGFPGCCGTGPQKSVVPSRRPDAPDTPTHPGLPTAEGGASAG